MRKTTFAILCLEGATLSFNVAAAAALIPSISQYFAVPQFVTGRIVWLYMLPYGLAALAYGPLVRSFDAKKIELVCFFLFTCANLAAAFAQNIQQLFIARFFMGVFGASVIPLVLILIADGTDAHKRGRFVGNFFSATFVASLAGLLLSGFVHWRLIFLIPGVFGLLLWIHMYLYLPAFKPREKVKMNYVVALRDRAILSIFCYIFLISLLYHSVQQWLAVYFSKSFQLGQFLISILITLTSFSGIFGELIGGRLADSIGRLRAVNAGTIIMVTSVLLLAFKCPVWVLPVLMVAWGLGWTINHAAVSTRLTDFPRSLVNEAASLNSGVRFIAGGLGVALGGMLMQKGFTLGFTVLTGCFFMLLALSRYLLVTAHQK